MRQVDELAVVAGSLVFAVLLLLAAFAVVDLQERPADPPIRYQCNPGHYRTTPECP